MRVFQELLTGEWRRFKVMLEEVNDACASNKLNEI